MKHEHIIHNTAEFVKRRLEGEGSGHDWWHIYRVWKTALFIGTHERSNIFIIQLAALLHDIADWKFHNGDTTIGPTIAQEFLLTQQVNEQDIDHICQIIKDLSFKGAGTVSTMQTIEGKIVQDADRLDAVGAIGIARTFAYGGYTKREIYNPKIKPIFHHTFEQYKKNSAPTINHFYEKLLLLKDLINTPTARIIAQERHQVMEQFLDNFFKEVSCFEEEMHMPRFSKVSEQDTKL